MPATWRREACRPHLKKVSIGREDARASVTERSLVATTFRLERRPCSIERKRVLLFAKEQTSREIASRTRRTGGDGGEEMFTKGYVWIVCLDDRSLLLCEDHVGGESPLWCVWVLLCTLDILLDSSWFGVLRHACWD